MSERLMNASSERITLRAFLRAARWRWRVAVILKGLAMSLTIGGLAFFGSAALADHFRYTEPWILGLRIASLAIFALALGFFLFKPLLKRIPDVRIARFIEERHRGLHDRLVTAAEFAERDERLHTPLVHRLVRDAAERIASVNLDAVTSRRRLRLYGGALLVLLGLFGWLFMAGPRPLLTGLAKLYAPWSEAAGISPYTITVTPGDARVPQGADQVIGARLHGFHAERVDLYLKRPDHPTWIRQPMDLDEEAQAYRFMLFNLQQDVTYYVQADHIRSPAFTITVAELAWVDQIDLTYQFPPYTHRPARTVENGGDIVAIKGTRVTVLATLTRPAEAATLVLHDGQRREMKPVGPTQFVGEIIVRSTTTYRIDLTSAGETYAGSNVYDITAVDDRAPTVTIEKPGRDVKATSIQEVFTQARAEDDNGIATLELRFSINGGDEQTVTLYRARRAAPQRITGTHTFFLEEFHLQPGDVISYYAMARDNNKVSGPGVGMSDIYFLQIRPFERTYRQAQQNMGPQGGEGSNSALTQRQKEIIAATWRVIRERPTSTPEEFAENMDTIALGQDRLREDTEALVGRIRRRLGMSLDEMTEFKRLADYLEQAAEYMKAALTELKARQPKSALRPEQRALQQLMRADTVFREIQVAFAANAQGSGDRAEAEDLADLFELELDRMKNQYETLQRDRGERQSRALDEALRKLKQLAERQQQLAEQQMRQSLTGGPPRQQGGAEQQRQLMEEAEKLARQLERLSRQRRDERLADISRQLQQAAEQMRRAQQSGNPAEAAARRLQAAEQLEAARRQLEANQRAFDQQAIEQLRQRASMLIERQREIVKEVDALWHSRRSADQQRQLARKHQVERRKESLAEQVEGLEQDLEATARRLGRERQSVKERLREAIQAIRRNRLPDKIRQGNRLLENEWYDQARQRERDIEEDLSEVARALQTARGDTLARSEIERLREALRRTRRFIDDLESLHRRLREQAQQAAERPPDRRHGEQGPPSPTQQRQAQARTNRPDEASTQSNRSPRGDERLRSRPFSDWESEIFPTSEGRPPIGGDRRQLRRELRQRWRDAEALRRDLGDEFADEIDALMRRLRQLDDRRLLNDPEEIARLKQQLIDPLRRLEHELMRRLELASGRGPMLADETSVPQAYRKLVEEYYRRLAKKKRRGIH